MLSTSQIAFDALRLARVACLFWLAWRALRRAADAEIASDVSPSLAVSYRRGFAVGITNPKVVLFFLAFFPQFIDSGAPAVPQVLVLGAFFVVLGLAADTVSACAADAIGRWLARRRRFMARRRAVEAGIYVALDGWALIAGGRDRP